MKQIVQIIDYLRIKLIDQHLNHLMDKKCLPWQLNLLDIDYTKVSEVAHESGLHHTAALMLELSLDHVV